MGFCNPNIQTSEPYQEEIHPFQFAGKMHVLFSMKWHVNIEARDVCNLSGHHLIGSSYPDLELWCFMVGSTGLYLDTNICPYLFIYAIHYLLSSMVDVYMDVLDCSMT